MKNYLLKAEFKIIGSDDFFTTEQIVNFEPKNNPAACFAQLLEIAPVLDIKTHIGHKYWICTNKITEIFAITIKDIEDA